MLIKVSKNPQQDNSEAVTNEHDKEIHKEIKRQEIIDDLRLKQKYNSGI